MCEIIALFCDSDLVVDVAIVATSIHILEKPGLYDLEDMSHGNIGNIKILTFSTKC